MLQRAIKYKSQVEDFINDLNNEQYLKYWFHSSRCHNGELKIEGDEWAHIHRVSIHPLYCKKILGYFHVSVDRDNNTVDSLSIMNMETSPNPVLVRDTLRFIDYLLSTCGFIKLSFSVSIGNPAEKQYDKIIERLGGRIVGIKKKDVRLLDGKYYDVKLYEIMRDNYRGGEVNGK